MVISKRINKKSISIDKKDEFFKGFRSKKSDTKCCRFNIAEGFDAESNAEFIRFLRYAKRSCTEVQSELFVAKDENYITPEEFNLTYKLAEKTIAAIRGFINYLHKYETQKASNQQL